MAKISPSAARPARRVQTPLASAGIDISIGREVRAGARSYAEGVEQMPTHRQSAHPVQHVVRHLIEAY